MYSNIQNKQDSKCLLSEYDKAMNNNKCHFLLFISGPDICIRTYRTNTLLSLSLPLALLVTAGAREGAGLPKIVMKQSNGGARGKRSPLSPPRNP